MKKIGKIIYLSFFILVFYTSAIKAEILKEVIITGNDRISDDKIVFLKLVSIVIKSGMNILGVNTPEKM